MTYLPTMAVHVVWHPACAEAEGCGRALFSHLFDDPTDLAAHGLRIPVRLWRSVSGRGVVPPPPVPPVRQAVRSVIVVLVDDEFIRADGWLSFLDDVGAAVRPGDLVLGVAVSEHATTIDSPLLETNFIRLYAVERELRERVVVNRVTHALCRLAADTDSPVTVFLSHAKLDGEEIARRVGRFLEEGTGVERFFDAQSLLEGSRFSEEIRGAAANNVLLAIRTDAYATREWCRTEVLEAKLGGSPVVVLDALEDQETRGFPYLGNAPAVRWRPGDSGVAMEELLGVVLKETLRFRHFPARVADLCRAYQVPDDPRVLPAPPELLTILRARAATSAGARQIVYPDPPLGCDELALVSELAPELEPITPTMLVAGR